MQKATRISDGKVLSYVFFDGGNVGEVRDLFASTNTPDSEVIACKTKNGSLQLKQMSMNPHAAETTQHARPSSYIFNSGGRPYVCDEYDFYRLFTGPDALTVLRKEPVESQTKPLWDNIDNTLHIRETLYKYFVEGDSYNPAHNTNSATLGGLAVTAFPVNSDFNAEAFQDFIGADKPFHVTYSYNRMGRTFKWVAIQTGRLFGVNITPGDSVVRTPNGALAVVHNSHRPF